MTKTKYNQLREEIIRIVPELDISYMGEEFEKNISLEDCLIAMSKKLLEKYIDIKWSANFIILIDNRLDNIGGDDRCIWVMNKPLQDQSEPTINLLWDLICKK